MSYFSNGVIKARVPRTARSGDRLVRLAPRFSKFSWFLNFSMPLSRSGLVLGSNRTAWSWTSRFWSVDPWAKPQHIVSKIQIWRNDIPGHSFSIQHGMLNFLKFLLLIKFHHMQIFLLKRTSFSYGFFIGRDFKNFFKLGSRRWNWKFRENIFYFSHFFMVADLVSPNSCHR